MLVRNYAPADATAFRELNEAWIGGYFTIEEEDRKALNNPEEYILQPGGAIFMAVQDGIPVGTCALLAMGGGEVEVAKMTVAEQCRGLGIGKKLLAHAIEHARAVGAKRLYLETNGKLQTAVHVYESLGFTHVPKERLHVSPYARADVFMELFL